MTLTGDLLIGASDVPATAGTMKAFDPSTNREIEPPFALGGNAEVNRAARLADELLAEGCAARPLGFSGTPDRGAAAKISGAFDFHVPCNRFR